RASTLVNYVGLDDGIMECVLEISGSKKLDKYLPGTAIPVLDEKKLYDDQPRYALLLSWHIADELSANLRRHGFRGSFIVPLSAPRLLDAIQTTAVPARLADPLHEKRNAVRPRGGGLGTRVVVSAVRARSTGRMLN